MSFIWVNPPELVDLRLKANLHQWQAAQLAGVALRTYKKYETSGKLPKSVYEMLIARAGAIWRGWSWWDGYLYDDIGRKWHQGSLMAAYYTLKASEGRNIEFHQRNSPSALYDGEIVNRAKPIKTSAINAATAANDEFLEDSKVD